MESMLATAYVGMNPSLLNEVHFSGGNHFCPPFIAVFLPIVCAIECVLICCFCRNMNMFAATLSGSDLASSPWQRHATA